MKREDLKRVRWVLNQVEWCETAEDCCINDYCPICHEHRDHGHEENCQMKYAIDIIEKNAIGNKEQP